MMKLTEALIPKNRWFVLVRQRNIVGGEKNLQKILLNILKWRAPATFDPVLDHEELADDEDDPGQVADGEDADHTRQHESQVRLMSSFFPGADVRVPENRMDLFIFCIYLDTFIWLGHCALRAIARLYTEIC